jgi:hypothetical protein
VKLAVDVATWRDYEATELLLLPPELRTERIEEKAEELHIPAAALRDLLTIVWAPAPQVA